MDTGTFDYSQLTKEQIKDMCMVESRNCVSVGRMLYLLGGSSSQYEFISDACVAHSIYSKAKQDIIDLGMFHDIMFFKTVNLGNIEAICVVVYYKKSKLQRPRLVVAAAIKVEYLGKKDVFNNYYTFVRTFHLPCKEKKFK